MEKLRQLHVSGLQYVSAADAVSLLLAGTVVALTVLLMLLWRDSKVPGPRLTIPLMGDTLAVRKDPLSYFLQSYLRHGPVSRTRCWA